MLNDHPDVSDEMKARVLKAAEQLGYQPNFLAQSLRTGARTCTVGFVVRDISIPPFAGIVKGAEQVLESYGYSVLLPNSLQHSALEAKHINVLRQRRGDGLILSLQCEANADTFRVLQNVRVSIILLDGELVGFPVDAVLFEDASGVHDAVSALVELGHRHIGLSEGSPETRAARDRIRGFTLACEEADMPAGWDNIVQLDTITPDATNRAAAALLDPHMMLTALVAGDAQLVIAVLAAMKERKLCPERDLSLVICDDLGLFRLLDPPISVVCRDAKEMGAATARILMRRLSDRPTTPTQEMLPTSFIDRGSTAPPSKKGKLAERQRHLSRVGDGRWTSSWRSRSTCLLKRTRHARQS